MDLTKKYQIKKYKEDKIICFNDDVIVETYFYIYQGEKILARLMCSPSNLEYLVIGHLYALDLINSKDDIIDLQIRDNKAYVKLKEEKSPKIKRNKGKFILEREKIFALANEFQNYSLIFKKTGGAHACAIIENYRIMEFFEDVARNNAVDKLIGYILAKEVDISDKFIFTSCRVSDQIIDKILKIDFDLIVSQASPTSVSIDMAREKNVNLIAFAREQRFNLYNKNENLIIKWGGYGFIRSSKNWSSYKFASGPYGKNFLQGKN